jgi:hypothetical protein
MTSPESSPMTSSKKLFKQQRVPWVWKIFLNIWAKSHRIEINTETIRIKKNITKFRVCFKTVDIKVFSHKDDIPIYFCLNLMGMAQLLLIKSVNNKVRRLK